MAVFKCGGRDVPDADGEPWCTHEDQERWLGRCPGCGGYWTCDKIGADKKKSTSSSFAALAVKETKYITTTIPEVDRVLGGGLVKGSTILICGPPKLGKSTLLVQIAHGISKKGTVLYCSGEQSDQDVGQIVHRTKSQSEGVELLGNCGDIRKIVEQATTSTPKPTLVIIDSLQTAYLNDIEAVEGSAQQVKEVVNHLTAIGKDTGICFIVICQVNKEGDLAGPKAIEHLVDTIVEFYPYYDEDKEEIDEDTLMRELSSSMNRNAQGPGRVRALFEMTTEGVKPVRVRSRLELV